MEKTNIADVVAVVPVYNDQKGLERTLGGLAAQTIGFDVVVVDDGSTLPVCIPKWFQIDGKVEVIRLETNSGISAALNTGLSVALSRGYEFVARLDAGDLPMRQRLECQRDFLLARPRVGVVGTWVRLVDANGSALVERRLPTSDRWLRIRHHFGSGFVHASTMIRTKALLDQSPVYSNSYPYAEDFDLWLRIQRSWQLANVPEFLLDVEVVAGSSSTGHRKLQSTSRLKLLRRELEVRRPLGLLGFVGAFGITRLSYQSSLNLKRLLSRATHFTGRRRA